MEYMIETMMETMMETMKATTPRWAIAHDGASLTTLPINFAQIDGNCDGNYDGN